MAKSDVLVGLLLGGSVAFLFSSLAIRAVGRAAMQVVVEVRNQFRDHPGIMDYTEKPDYGRVVDICTRTSLRELMTPGLLAVLSPLIAGFFLGAEALGAFLAGSILTGQLLAVMLSNSGGAWDNAKKYIEEGHYGGKGSEAHTAAVIGDTVGDPFKDTAGPALNPLIKVMNLVALLIAPIVVTHADDTAIRVAVVAVSVVILATMIWVSKSRKSELGERDQGEGRRGSARLPLTVSVFRRLIDRLNESDETRLADETRAWASTIEGSARIADAPIRQHVRIAGVIRRMTVLPMEGKEALQALISDGTGEMTIVFMGRRGIGGLSLGKRVVVEGVLGEHRGDIRMVNPQLEFAG